MRGNNGHALHQFQHFRRVISAIRDASRRSQQRKAAFHHAVRRVVTRAARLWFADIFAARGKCRAGILRLEPIDHGLDAFHVFVANVVLFAQFCGDVDVRDVVAGNRVDAVERLEQDPFLAEVGGNLREIDMPRAGETVGEIASIVARIGVIKARGAFQRRFAARMPLLRQRNGQHGVARRRAFAQRGAFEIASREIHA